MQPRGAAIREVNPSCYAFELPGLWDALDRLDTGNAQGEYYLTDAPQLARQSMGRRVIALPCLEPTTSSASTPASTSPRPTRSSRGGSRTG